MSMIGNWRRITAAELAALQAQQTTVTDFLYEQEAPPETELDVDKTWHAIHYLLNGEAWIGSGPLNNVVMGGTPISEEDVGYGPARFLTTEQVRETAAALQNVSSEQLLAKFNAEQLCAEEIYPQQWADNEEDRSYISSYYTELVNFFQKAAASSNAMLVYIN